MDGSIYLEKGEFVFMFDKLFAPVDLLQKGMEASWLRNTVIRNNLANVETPGFKGSDVDFESVLASSLESDGFVGRRTRDKHIEIGAKNALNTLPRIVQNDNLSMRMDGNNVDIEAENAKLAQNTIKYNTMVSKLNSELARLRMAISEGR